MGKTYKDNQTNDKQGKLSKKEQGRQAKDFMKYWSAKA